MATTTIIIIIVITIIIPTGIYWCQIYCVLYFTFTIPSSPYSKI